MRYTVEYITMEEKIMDKTFSAIYLFHQLFLFANLLIVCTIAGTILSYALEGLFDIDISILLLLAVFLILNALVMLIIHRTPLAALSPHYAQLINFGSLYADRSSASECISYLRGMPLENPYSNFYVFTLVKNNKGTSCFCKAILWFGPNSENDNVAVAEEWMDRLAESIAQPDFIGVVRLSLREKSGDDMHASLYCRDSWGGIAHWIARRLSQK